VQLPAVDVRIETCWSDFKYFNVKILCALFGVLIKLLYEMHGATIKIVNLI